MLLAKSCARLAVRHSLGPAVSRRPLLQFSIRRQHALASDSPVDYCASLVRRLDPDAWLTSYFWPSKERRWYLAIRAFNIELHLVTLLTQPALAAIRFQFWRDTIKGVYTGSVPQHPVAVLLAEMRKERPVQRYYLSQMIDVRSKTLSLPPASTSLAEYLATYGPLHSALLLGPLPLLLPPTDPSTNDTAHVLSHLASLLAVVSLLRNLPVLAQTKHQLNLPADVCARHGVIEEDVLRNGAKAKGFRDAVFQVGTRGMDELITARREGIKANPLSLASIPAERYLQRLEALDFDCFDASLLTDWKLAPRIWWRNMTGRL